MLNLAAAGLHALQLTPASIWVSTCTPHAHDCTSTVLLTVNTYHWRFACDLQQGNVVV